MRSGRRVESRYRGAGELARLVDEVETIERRERAEQRAEERAWLDSARGQERQARERFDAAEAVADGFVLAAGYHKHKGQWRRDRGMTTAIQAPAPTTFHEFQALVNRARGGDKGALKAVRRAVKADPRAPLVTWFQERFGSPAEWLKTYLSTFVMGDDDPAIVEASLLKMEQVRRDLEGPAPSPVESLLAERAALCWFTVNAHEVMYMHDRKDLTNAQTAIQLRRINAAHARFLTSLATLARVRRLALPVLMQVNVGAQQVNVAGSSS